MKNTVLEIGGENKMGFRTGAYAKVWKTEDKGNYSVVELSTSKKNKQTGKYETDFNGKFVRFIGQAHTDIKKYGDGIKIKLGDVEVTNSYNKETKIGYTNFLVFSFEAEESNTNTNTGSLPTGNEDFMKIEDIDLSELPFQ
jgi:hypothetical protein